MNTKRKSFTCFLSCLLALCLLLSIIPAMAESPATPTDLGPVIDEVREDGQSEGSGEPEAAGEAEITGDSEDPDGLSGEDGLPSVEEAEETDSGEPDPVETEPVETDPYLATLKTGARLYADKDCYRKQQILAEEAVVLVVKTEENSSEILYAYLDVEDQIVPGKAYAHAADLIPLTEEETAAWQATVHPAAIERLGFKVEPATFEADAEKEPETAEKESANGESEETLDAEHTEESVSASDRIPADEDNDKSDLLTDEPATPTDLSAASDASECSGASDTEAENLSGDSFSTPDLPTPRNQGSYGTCWAFSAIGAVEIYLIKTGNAQASSVDLSELFLVYYVYHVFPDAKPGGTGDTVENSTSSETYMQIGGNNLLAIRVLENLIGTVTESTVPYSSAPSAPTKYSPVEVQLTGAYLVDVGSTNKEKVKQLIRDHGAVGASIWMPDAYNTVVNVPAGNNLPAGLTGFKSSTCALYGTTRRANHDILLVGWDDDFPRTSFVSGLQPSKNGAWKVRNSWGSSWGQSGYFWVSYEDAALAQTEGTAYSAINSKTEGEEVPDFCYSYSKIPDTDSYEEGTAWVLKRSSPVNMIQTFTVDGNEKILSVGVETGTPNVTITVAVAVEDDPVMYTGTVTANHKGFYRIKLDKPAIISSRKIVKVTVTYKHSKTGTQITVPYEPGSTRYSIGSYQYTTHSGSGGFYLNNEKISNADSCIKVYTKKDSSSGVTKVELKCDSPSVAQAETISISNARLGSRYQLIAIPYPAIGVDTTIRWTSTNPSVATVSQSGLVTVRMAGTTDIVATSVTGVRGVCKISAPKVNPKSIKIESYNGVSEYTINNTNAGSFTIGDVLTIWARENPEYNTEKDVIWETSDSSVLQITDTGWEDNDKNHRFCNIKVLGNGRTIITIWSRTNPEVNASISLVIDLVTGVTLDRSSCELIEGSGIRLGAVIQPGDGWNRNLSWSSSNTSVATVDTNGYVRAVKSGKAIITVTTMNGGKKATCVVTVSPKDPIEAFVTRMYRICLQREPDDAGLQGWVSALRSGQATGAQVAYGFYNSSEMIKRRLPNEQYIALAYVGIMGREADAGGKAVWTDVLDSGMSYSSIISGFTRSQEFTNLCASYGIVRGDFESSEPRDQNQGITGFVSRLYTKMLGRCFDADGLNAWCTTILAEPTKAMLLNVSLTGFMHSPEFESKGLNDEAFVKVLYRTFLGRECDAAGLKAWITTLQSGSTRDEVAAGFAYSPEFSNIMAQYGF